MAERYRLKVPAIIGDEFEIIKELEKGVVLATYYHSKRLEGQGRVVSHARFAQDWERVP